MDFAAAHGVESCEAAVDQLSRQTPDGIAYQNAAVRPTTLGIFTMEDAPGGGGGRHVVGFTRCLS